MSSDIRPLDANEIVELIKYSLIQAVRAYERFSAGEQMPEFWLRAQLVDAFDRAEMLAVPERLYTDIAVECSANLPASWILDRKKADIVLYDPQTVPGGAHSPIALIEVKSPVGSNLRNDCQRVEEMVKAANGKLSHGYFIHVSGPMSKGHIAHTRGQFREWTGIGTKAFDYIGPYKSMRLANGDTLWHGFIVPFEPAVALPFLKPSAPSTSTP